jgi:hypothetical protein
MSKTPEQKFDIHNTIHNLMLEAEFMLAGSTGSGKKDFVMRKLRGFFATDQYDVIEPILSSTIDFIIAVAKKRVSLKDLNGKVKWCF